MSRFADALKRARTESVLGSESDGDRGDTAIRFFAPGQPAVVAPWDLGRDIGTEPDAPPAPLAPPAPAPPRATSSEPRSSTLLPERSLSSDAAVYRPTAKISDKLVSSPEVLQIVREQYNKLAVALHQLQLERQMNVVMITSAVPHEGKTLTATNLALTLSESYQRRVLLIDADIRHPSIHTVFGASNARGLNDSLGRGRLPLQQINSRLSILTAGRASGDPMKTLTSDLMRTLIEEARAEFDWVLLDTAPIGLLPDASVLAAMADGTLFVALAGKTAYDLIQRATEVVGADRILGVVLNGMAESALPSGEYSYYYGSAPHA
jgi:capsular exopolysaccharide synthesis family protein